jgi:hypothetical protein
MIARRRFNVTLYLDCLSCCYILLLTQIHSCFFPVQFFVFIQSFFRIVRMFIHAKSVANTAHNLLQATLEVFNARTW